MLLFQWHNKRNEPPHKKTSILHMRKQRRRTAKLISAFVFATRIVQFLYFLNPKFPVFNHLLYLYSPLCLRPVQKPHCWFSQEAAQIMADCIRACLLGGEHDNWMRAQYCVLKLNTFYSRLLVGAVRKRWADSRRSCQLIFRKSEFAQDKC